MLSSPSFSADLEVWKVWTRLRGFFVDCCYICYIVKMVSDCLSWLNSVSRCSSRGWICGEHVMKTVRVNSLPNDIKIRVNVVADSPGANSIEREWVEQD